MSIHQRSTNTLRNIFFDLRTERSFVNFVVALFPSGWLDGWLVVVVVGVVVGGSPVLEWLNEC